MMTVRGRLGVAGGIIIAIIAQTTVVSHVRVTMVAPDIVVVAVVLASLRIRAEAALAAGFLSGLAIDTLSASVIGLRAFTYTAVVYLALVTRRRADLGPPSAVLWVGGLSGLSEILVIVVGAIFGEARPAPGQALQEVLVVAVLNTVLAALLLPVIARLLAPPH